MSHTAGAGPTGSDSLCPQNSWGLLHLGLPPLLSSLALCSGLGLCLCPLMCIRQLPCLVDSSSSKQMLHPVPALLEPEP